jgi:hypothetical protein
VTHAVFTEYGEAAMHSLKSGVLCGVLAIAGSTAVYAGPPKSAAPPKSDAPAKSDVDVTITVIEDPAQLNERVNTLTLPGSDGDDSHSSKSHNKNDSASTDDRANEAGESARQDAAKARADREAAHDSDTGGDSNQ